MNNSFIKNLQKISVFQVFILIGILFSTIYFFLYYRDQQIIAVYEKETNLYIEKNKEGLKLVFTTIFDKASKCTSKECFHNIGLEVKNKIKTDLEDFDRLYFIKLIDSSGQITLGQMYTFGDFSKQTIDPTITPSITPVVKLLYGNGNKSIFWNNSLSMYKGKEIVIPVIIEDQIIGAVVRKVR